MIGIVTKDSNGNVIESVEYTYDVFGKRIAKSVDNDGDGVGGQESETYVYYAKNIALVFDYFFGVAEFGYETISESLEALAFPLTYTIFRASA